MQQVDAPLDAAQVLREAADAFPSGYPSVTPAQVRLWLRRRADDLQVGPAQHSDSVRSPS